MHRGLGPQLIQPYAFDQFDNGARIEKLGVGRTISKRSFRAPNIIQCLKHLLTSVEINIACRTIKDTFKEKDPLAESCVLIEKVMT